MPVTPADREHFASIMHRMAQIGSLPIALYGAGRVADDLRPTFAAPADSIIGIIDDDPARIGRSWARLPVISAGQAIEAKVKAVIITAEGAAQHALFERRRPFLRAGAQVFCCPARFESREWDGALSDWYEHRLARSRGIDLVWPHEYPDKDAKASSAVIDFALARLPKGGAVCEIGPGAGIWTERLLPAAGRYYAADYSARLLHEVIEHRFAADLDKLSVHHDEHARLPGVPDDSVDLVFSYDVFVHFKIDLVHQFLASIRRVLKPGGGAMIHFARWNAAAIDVWSVKHTRHHNGGQSLIHYNHPDWLTESARAHGLRFEPLGEPFGWNYLGWFTRA